MYVKRNDIIQAAKKHKAVSSCCADLADIRELIYDIPSDGDVIKVTRCKDCKYHRSEPDISHGKTVHFCSKLNKEVAKDFYCGSAVQQCSDSDKPGERKLVW